MVMADLFFPNDSHLSYFFCDKLSKLTENILHRDHYEDHWRRLMITRRQAKKYSNHTGNCVKNMCPLHKL